VSSLEPLGAPAVTASRYLVGETSVLLAELQVCLDSLRRGDVVSFARQCACVRGRAAQGLRVRAATFMLQGAYN